MIYDIYILDSDIQYDIYLSIYCLFVNIYISIYIYSRYFLSAYIHAYIICILASLIIHCFQYCIVIYFDLINMYLTRLYTCDSIGGLIEVTYKLVLYLFILVSV